uniref:Hemolectin n=1 Tax=Nipponaphis monzeni TaxID=196483 RepID=A0A481MQJ2_9HEMI
MHFYWSFLVAINCLLFTTTVQFSLAEFQNSGGISHVEYTTDFLDDDHVDETADTSLFPNDDPKQQSDYQSRISNYGTKSSKITFPESPESSDACLSTFTAPEHSYAICSKASKNCQATCIEGYKFAKGISKITFVCDGPKYKVKGSSKKHNIIPSCMPVCNLQCENGGVCEKPNKCSCPKNFDGPFCQNFSPSWFCHSFPNTPLNSKKICNSDVCTISCLEGYQFPDFSTVANVLCKNGSWTPEKLEWSTVPDCKPICNPPCLNGGNCISYQKCQCSNDFRGPRCQHPESSCDVSKLNFNGNYKCSNDKEKNVCTLSCPQGSILEPFKTPNVEYTCLFETGEYEPKHIPQCMFDDQPSPLIHVVSTVVEVINTFKNRPESCIRWGYGNYKTFDGKVYSFLSDCTYTLISDINKNSFHVQAHFDRGAVSYINVFVFDNLYQIKRNTNENIVSLSNNGKLLAVPNELVDIGVEVVSGQTILINLRINSLKIIWKSNGILQIDAGTNLWNSTDGLCGRMDGLPENDLSHNSITSFVNIWLVSEPNDMCEYSITDNILNASKELISQALEFCSLMMTDKFKVCSSNHLNTQSYVEACKMDYIQCVVANGSDCGCSSMAAYALECFGKEQMTLWRDKNLCPYQCSAEKVYSQCLPTVQETCSIEAGVKSDNINTFCEEGCVCPFGTVLNDDVCVVKEKCPCKLRNTFYQPGEEISKDCNKCTCIGGEWSCTNAKCRAECYAIGDPHYKTFDGMKFNFMGFCSYYLVVLPEFSIEAENIPCDGTMSLEHGFETINVLGKSSCTKTVTIRFGNNTNIKLGQGKTVFVNDESVEKLPVSIQSLAYIREQSTFFLQILISNGIEVWWDGETRMYIYASPELEGKTRGLCGTFNGNQNDDMFTPEGDIETNVVSFGNKWKTKESCVNKNLETTIKTSHPCDENIQFKHLAENYCSNITGKLFSNCHTQVDPIPYYDDCLYDVCSCHPSQFSRCYCQILASYALECSHQSTIIDWRKEVRECGLQCPAGQYYNTCGNSCQRTCHDISIINSCKSNCVEGCYCPKGLTLSETGECIPVNKCPCYYNGQQFNSGQKRIEVNTEKKQLCTCKSATWECRLVEKTEIAQWKNISESSCSRQDNLKFTECEPSEPLTCRNMHDPPQSTPAMCYSGCICKEPYVLDSFTKKCVLPTECPCHHGGKSYNNNETFYQGCNTCECKVGKWKCTDNECPGICSVWGDSHFKTFDSRYFDFQGACEYILSKGSFSSYESFVTSLEIVPCGSTGATCIKSVTLAVGSGDEVETILLKYKQYSSSTKRITIKEVGNIFVVVEVPDLGLQIFWDKGTRIHLKVDEKWKNKIKGLCGNYNDNQMDDFQTPYGGVPEVSASLFGDSWKLQPYCSQPSSIRDACVVHPHRRQWAIQQCSILKSSIFKPCHSQVSVNNYIERCIFDTCACDQGGDCECLCTSIAAYAQECSIHGIFIQWRSQNMCPMQCENGTLYDSCIPRCSQKSCEDYEYQTALCDDTFCIEGCSKDHCPPGQVYINSTSEVCISKHKCKIPCKIEGIDKVFNDGDVVVEDSCHSCFCSRNRKVCKGQPCPTTITTTTVTTSTTTTIRPVSEKTNNKTIKYSCSDGWSAWINVNQPKNEIKFDFLPTFEDINSKKNNDVNSLEEVLGTCERREMIDIQCRSLKRGKSVKGIKEKVDCSLHKGLECNGRCSDYEIRVLCKCETKNSFEDENLGEVVDGERVVNKTRIVCPDGFQWHSCKVMCNQVCHAFENQLKTTNMCVFPQKCIGGCGKENQQSPFCAVGSMWRDNNTCVTKSDCNCFSRNGTEIKPGGVFKEDLCTVCQCINNAYICDNSSCQYKPTIDNVELKTEQFHQTTETTELATNPTHQTTVQIELTTVEELSTTTEKKPLITEYLNTVKWPQSTTLRPLVISTTIRPDEVFIVENTETTNVESIFVPTTVSPPITLCDTYQIKPIAASLGLFSYNASSWYNDAALPHFAQLYPEENSYWKPLESSENEYLQINLSHAEIIYGVEVSGNPLNDEFVTSYKVAYSMDGISFSYVSFHGQPEVFRGPRSHDKIETQMFFTPIEAVYIRFLPSTWRNNIALRVALLGCPVSVTSLSSEIYSTINPTIIPICSDPMGIESGLLNNNMVSVSSSMLENFSSLNVSLNSKTAWVPFTASSNQWIQIDFTEPRIITGVVTKGISSTTKIGEAWTEAYIIVYSNDLINWNKILDSSSEEKIYTANIDGQNSHTIFFNTPIKARYIRLHPVKWYNMPALRLEILGCFEAYATEETIIQTTIKPVINLLNCNICPGIRDNDCSCSSDTWWNGESCGLRSECPCVLGFMTYQVGTVYDLENCQQCTCTLGGLPDCAPKMCAPCPPGEVYTTSVSNCDCKCESCKNGTKLCVTSNICINESLWCNGIQDCPDDEINCSTTTIKISTPLTTTTVAPTTTFTEHVTSFITIIPPKKRNQGLCPEIKCPEGQIARILNSSPVKSNSIKFARKTRSLEIIDDDPWPSPFNPVTNLAASLKKSHRDPHFSTKGSIVRRKGDMTFGIKNGGVKNDEIQPICKQWICEAIVEQSKCKTSSIICPEGYFSQIAPNKNEICPVYTCVSNTFDESECEVNGRVFKTFDGITFKYEVCDHIIVQDRVNKKWIVKQIRHCPYIGNCQISLWIKHMNNFIEFFPNMTTTYDGYLYTVNQLQIIGSQTTEFAVKQVQSDYIIFASTLGFNIIWQVNGQVKIKVNAYYTGRVDGLCGYFDNNPKNDKLKRDGLVSTSTSEFGNSWADSSIQCEAKICPLRVQKAALEACNSFRLEPLNHCGKHENIEELVMKCVERICSCSENSASDYSECRCKAISGLVTQCYISNSSVELSDWRILHDCPVNCPAPLVYKECFNRVCEPSCDSLLQNDPCPKLPGLCFPGCYCPDGLIKDFGTCIKPSKCKNCICEGSGTSQYTTFDKVDFTHKQNCSHILVKTTKENDSSKPGFSIIETTGICSNLLFTNGICVQNLTIIHAAHKLHLHYNIDGSKIQVSVDGNEVKMIPFINKWLSISESPGKSITVIIPILEIEIIFMTMNQGFSIKMPSHLYYDKTEGLCGSCNGDSMDDMAAPDGNIPMNVDEFVKSWKANETDLGHCENIFTATKEKEDTCSIPKPDVDPCLKLMDSKIFGQCHAIVDVNLYLKKCHSILCQGHEGSFCHSLEAYVRECQSFGVCLDWRSPNLCPYSCPKGLLYKTCSSGCEETCDNYKLLRSGEIPCKNLPTEMCTCPTGQVFNNSVCVNENRCEPCDSENHFVGDVWLVDKCTECTCIAGSKTVRCEKKQCNQPSFAICQTGFKSIKNENNSDECCEQYKCIPEENTVQDCVDIAVPVCATDQVVKIELASNGCKRFICECKPKDQCVSVSPDKDVELLPGMVNVMNNQGCCPSFQAICAPNTCPTPQPCPMYHNRIEIGNYSCCPQFKCELPNNTCIYEYEWIASIEGGERKRLDSEKTVDLKQLNDSWEDGPCRLCYCDMSSTRGICNKIECAAPIINSEYIIVSHTKYGQCCPSYKKQSCIFNGTVYNVGSEWSSLNPCVTMSCKLDSNGEAYMTESLQNCNTDCPLGWTYMPSTTSCCGICTQKYCVMQNKTYGENNTWTYDNCTSFICSKTEFNEFNIIPAFHSCPNIGDCPENKIYYDGCCEQCNTTGVIEIESHSLCAPESLPSNQTIGLVVEDSPFHDECANVEPINGFTECRGLCDSYTYFNKKTIKHDSKCQCCQPIRFDTLSVILRCKDGYQYKKSITVPLACSCTACGGESFSIKKSKKF